MSGMDMNLRTFIDKTAITVHSRDFPTNPHGYIHLQIKKNEQYYSEDFILNNSTVAKI